MNLDWLLTELGWRREGRASKFVAYFHLVDACDKPGCPVCRCLRELTFRSLDGLLYEHVTDPATREVLGQSWGFCAWHASMSKRVRHAGLGMAMIYQDLLSQVRTRLTTAQGKLTRSPIVPRWRRLFRRPEPVHLVRARASRRRCPLCATLASAETSYLETLVDYIEDPELERVYACSVGLCLPHITLALATFPGHRGAVPLLTRAVRALDRLTEDLRGFIDKHDYRKRAPLTEAEAAAWRDALAFLAGDPGLFGNEIRREGTARAAGPRADTAGG